MISLNYKLDKDDHLAYQLFVASKSERIIKKRKRATYRLPVIYLVLAGILLYAGRIDAGLIFIMIALLWIIFYPIYERYRYVKHYKGHVADILSKQIDNEAHVELDIAEIKTKDESGEATMKIEKISEINETGTHFFIRFDPAMGLVLPKDKIANVDEIKDWIKTVKEKYQLRTTSEPEWKWS